MYAKVNGQQLIQYPYGLSLLYAEYPNTSFPVNITDEILTNFNIARVVVTGQPQHNTFLQTVEETTPIFVQERNRWEQQWSIRNATTEEIENRKKELKDSIVKQTQYRLDTFAQSRNYDGIMSACTYSDSLVQKFRTEGQYCLAQRDNTWAKLYEILAEVEAGTRPFPSGFADIEPDLPVLEWPNP